MGEVIAILSGKGGTGKTSVCAGIASALAEAGTRVLCVDCDVGLRNLDISLGLSESGGLSFMDVCRGGYPLSQATVHPDYPTLFFLTAPMNCLPDDIDPDRFRKMLRQDAGDFDYIFLDCAAGVDTMFSLTASAADRCLVVTGPGPGAIRDAARVGELLALRGRENARLIVNRVTGKIAAALDLTVDDVMDITGLPLLGVVPEDMNVTLAASYGQPLLKFRKKSSAAGACRRIAKRIRGLPEPINLR